MKRNFVVTILFVLAFSFVLTGCTIIFQKGRRSDIEKIKTLTSQLDRLNRAQRILENKLSKEIKDKEVTLQQKEKGLVITFLADILFDSGKAIIRPQAYKTLDKVANVLEKEVPDFNIGIEGHTDNEPIKYSKWKSNWELSSHRALSVLHYLVDKKAIDPIRVSAIGYGEYRPVASNATKEGRQLNRRVEIVILPKISKIGPEVQASSRNGLLEPQENLK